LVAVVLVVIGSSRVGRSPVVGHLTNQAVECLIGFDENQRTGLASTVDTSAFGVNANMRTTQSLTRLRSLP